MHTLSPGKIARDAVVNSVDRRLQKTSSSLYWFMSLFDDVEKMMIGKKDTATESKVDVDVKGSIFGKITTLI